MTVKRRKQLYLAGLTTRRSGGVQDAQVEEQKQDAKREDLARPQVSWGGQAGAGEATPALRAGPIRYWRSASPPTHLPIWNAPCLSQRLLLYNRIDISNRAIGGPGPKSIVDVVD